VLAYFCNSNLDILNERRASIVFFKTSGNTIQNNETGKSLSEDCLDTHMAIQK
jgi:hypothetical protein